MKQYARVDFQKPIVTVTFTGEKSTDENLQQYFADLESSYDDRQSLALIFVASQATIPSLSHQKKQALWISQHWKTIQTYCKGTAYIIPNFAIRAVLKMIFSFQNQPVPYKIFSRIVDAESWVKEHLLDEKQISS